MTNDIHQIMRDLSQERPLFYSEADFQHSLAWKLREQYPNARIRLEYPAWHVDAVKGNARQYLDIWIACENWSCAIELKYKTRKCEHKIGDEAYILRDQAAQDIGRYDFLKDVCRLEAICTSGRVAGYAVFLTNDKTYWTECRRSGSVDSAFRLHQDRMLCGEAAWDTRASEGTQFGRKDRLMIRGRYKISWHDFANLGFRYAIVNVAKAQGADRADIQ